MPLFEEVEDDDTDRGSSNKLNKLAPPAPALPLVSLLDVGKAIAMRGSNDTGCWDCCLTVTVVVVVGFKSKSSSKRLFMPLVKDDDFED